MRVTINGCELNVEVMGPEDGPVLIAHHGGGGIGSLAEPKTTFGPLSDRVEINWDNFNRYWPGQERELFLCTVRDFLDSAVP